MGSLASSNVQCFQRNWMDLSSQNLVSGNKTTLPCISKYTGFCLFAFQILSLLPTEQIVQLCLTFSEQGKLSQMGNMSTQTFTSYQPISAFFWLVKFSFIWFRLALKLLYVQSSKSSPNQQIPVQKGSAKPFYRRTEWLRLEDASGDHLVQLLLKKQD